MSLLSLTFSRVTCPRATYPEGHIFFISLFTMKTDRVAYENVLRQEDNFVVVILMDYVTERERER